jgi:DNA-binding CsgD family transcriptional regulator
MPRLLVLLYFIISYSIGLVALFFCLIQLIADRTRTLLFCFLSTLSMTVVVFASILMNYLGIPEKSAGWNALSFTNYICAAAMVYLLPAFVNLVYQVRAERRLNRFFLFSASACAVAVVLLFIVPLPDTAGKIVLAVKNAAILYAVILALARLKRKQDDEFRRFMQIISIGTIFMFPGMIVTEILPELGFPGQSLRLGGPELLPIVYAFWGGAYLSIRLGRYFRRTGILAEVDARFVERHGISPREMEVLALLLQGKSYKDIMEGLFISMPTVKTHVSSIYKKTMTANRMALARLVERERG